MRVVSNTSPLIFLAKLGKLKFLNQYDVIIPEEVYKEVERGKGRDEFVAIRRLIEEGGIKIGKTEIDERLPVSLHQGERAVISLALKEGVDIVLVDERKARIVARLYDLKPRGTISILRQQYLDGRMNKVQLREMVFELIEKGYRIKEEILVAFLKDLEADKNRET